MLWSAVAQRTRTPLLVAAGRRAALSLRCPTTAVSTRSGDADAGQDAVHGKTRAYQDKILQALQAYKKIEGDTVVPHSFVVPAGDHRWPKVAWGYRLGVGVNQLRTQLQAGKLYSEDRVVPTEFLNELEKLDFVRDFYQYQWSEVIMPALRRYYEIESHLDVPRPFVVPRGDETWPKASWGRNLGITVIKLRSQNSYAEQVAADRKELEQMGFCFTTITERDWKERVRRSFRGRRKRVSYGMQSTRDREILDSLDFVWNVRDFVWKEQMVPALKVYSEKHGHCRIAQQFVVPSELPWPKKAWGVQLGVKLTTIRNQGAFFAYFGRDAELLNTLGFNMLSAAAFEKRVAPLIDLYASVTGNQDIPDDFVIPSGAPWPEEMRGVHLGLIVARNVQHLR